MDPTDFETSSEKQNNHSTQCPNTTSSKRRRGPTHFIRSIRGGITDIHDLGTNARGRVQSLWVFPPLSVFLSIHRESTRALFVLVDGNHCCDFWHVGMTLKFWRLCYILKLVPHLLCAVIICLSIKDAVISRRSDFDWFIQPRRGLVWPRNAMHELSNIKRIRHSVRCKATHNKREKTHDTLQAWNRGTNSTWRIMRVLMIPIVRYRDADAVQRPIIVITHLRIPLLRGIESSVLQSLTKTGFCRAYLSRRHTSDGIIV